MAPCNVAATPAPNRHSREGGNPARDSPSPSLGSHNCRKPSFSRRRESTSQSGSLFPHPAHEPQQPAPRVGRIGPAMLREPQHERERAVGRHGVASRIDVCGPAGNRFGGESACPLASARGSDFVRRRIGIVAALIWFGQVARKSPSRAQRGGHDWGRTEPAAPCGGRGTRFG